MTAAGPVRALVAAAAMIGLVFAAAFCGGRPEPAPTPPAGPADGLPS